MWGEAPQNLLCNVTYENITKIVARFLIRYADMLRKKVLFSKTIPPQRSIKQFYKKHLHPNLFKVGKKVWYILLAAVELLRISKDLIGLRWEGRSFRYILWLANPGSLGGTELQVQIIAERMKECLVVASGTIEEGGSNLFLRQLRFKGIPLLLVGKRGVIRKASSFFPIRVAARLLRWVSPKGEICHFFNPASMGFVKAAKKAGFKIYYMETGMPDRGTNWESLRNHIADFDYVTSVSHAGLKRLRELFGYAGPGSVVPSMIYPISRNKICRKEGFHLIYLGRLTPIKRVDSLILSFAHLLEQVPNAKLTIIGSGELFDALNGQVAALGIGKQVGFTGWLKQDEVGGYLAEADLVCLPSETEGLPCTILEAVSMGVPVLATCTGGVSEVVEHGVNGLLVEPCNEKALTEALIQLATDRALCAQLSKGALASWEKQGDSMIKLKEAYGCK